MLSCCCGFRGVNNSPPPSWAWASARFRHHAPTLSAYPVDSVLSLPMIVAEAVSGCGQGRRARERSLSALLETTTGK